MVGIEQKGRLLYIDPTNVSFSGPVPMTDNSSTKIFNPLEDYCIAVDLIVTMTERQACGLGSLTNQSNYEITFTTANKTISFFHGSETQLQKTTNGSTEGYTVADGGYLSTDYTDVDLLNPEGNTDECLGIEHISIEYESWQYPIVTIKFIDVRGASVFAPAEANQQNYIDYDSPDAGNRNKVMLYRSLFSFPYPLFKLKVKGFYGKGATFYLTVEDVHLNFDSNTGNFEITAKFIGTMYRIYTDIPMLFAAVAPYMEIGADHWQKMVDDDIFIFKDTAGVKSSNMIKFPELTKKLADIEFGQSKQDLEFEKGQYAEEVSNKRASLNRFKGLIVADSHEITGTDNKSYLVCLSADEYKNQVQPILNEYFSKIQEYDNAYGTNLISLFPNLSMYSAATTNPVATVTYNIQKDVVTPSISPNNSSISTDNLGTINKIATSRISSNKGKKIFAYILKNDIGYQGQLNENINEQLKQVDDDEQRKEEEFKQEEDKMIETSLGFKPSIENMYNLAFAHMDTLIYTINETLKTIHSQLDDGTSEIRLRSNKGGMEYSDLTDQMVNIPPFPAVYCDETKNWENTTVQRKVEKWIGDIEGLKDFEEVKLVESLLKAAVLYTDDIQQVENFRQQQLAIRNESGGTEGNFDSETGTTGGQTEFSSLDNDAYIIPTTNYDFNNHYNSSPYSSIKSLYTSNSDEAISSTLFIFLNRAFYFLLNWRNSASTAASAFGVLEGYNFYKGIGKPNTNQLSELCKTLNEINISDIATKAASKDDTYTKSWSNLGTAYFNKSILSKNTTTTSDGRTKNTFKYNLRGKASSETQYNQRRPIPIGLFDPMSVKDGLGKPLLDLAKSDNVLLTSNLPSGVTTGAVLNGDTFIINDNPSLLETVKKLAIGKIDKFDKLAKYKDTAKILYTGKDQNKYEQIDEVKLDKSEKYGFVDVSGNTVEYDKALLNKYETYINNIPLNFYEYTGPVNDEHRDYIIGDRLMSGFIFLNTYFEKHIKETDWGEVQRGDYSTQKMIHNIGIGTYPKIYLLFAGYRYFSGNYAMKLPKGVTSNSQQGYLRMNEAYNHPKEKALIKYYKEWVEKNRGEIETFLSNYNKDNYTYHNHSDGTFRTFKSSINKNDPTYSKIQRLLRDLFLTKVCVIDYCYGINYYNSDNAMYRDYINEDSLNSAFESFRTVINDLYSSYTPENNTANVITEQAKNLELQIQNSDIKLATYSTLKTLYDKWLCAPYKGPDTWDFSSPKSDFQSFTYIDTLYNKIGLQLTTNLTEINEFLSTCMPTSNLETVEGTAMYNNDSVYTYLARIAEQTGGILMAFPQAIGGMGEDSVADMFRAMPYLSDWETDSSTFVYIYHYKPSDQLGSGQYADNGFQLTSEEAEGIFSNANGGYNIPGFGVTFAKQNQSFFNNISLNTENAQVTEASIAATSYIASKGSSLPRSTTLFGQDLYKVRTSYSYQCEFDMMGNMQIMPLMYFQLNNIPFWNGAYMIYKVSHEISPGDMKTHVAGYRINKYSLPLTEGPIITLNGAYGSGLGKASDGIYIPDDKYPVPTGDEANALLGKYDFNRMNVSEDNPVICVIPAHGPNFTKRTAEWLWSNDVVDRICKILNTEHFKKNNVIYTYNVQKCNKDGAFTDSSHNYMTQVNSIIKDFGSKKVIAFTPHWGNASKTDCVIYYGGVDENKQSKVRDDSRMFASIVSDNIKSFIENKNLHKSATAGMFETNTSNPNCVRITTSKKDVLEEVTVSCPTVAVQFWNDGYPPSESCKKALTRTALQVEDAPYKEKNSDGTYKLSQGWLMSDEGKNAIARIACDSIKSFISTLPYNKNNDWTANLNISTLNMPSPLNQ